MKRIILVGAILVAAFFIYFPVTHFRQPSVIPTATTVKASPSVSIVINTGENVATLSGVIADTAYQALQVAAGKQHMHLTTKQYDFGVFVKAVGSLANTQGKSWIYFVNGKAGTVAADKQAVHTGDTVEWKYTTPASE